MADDKLRLVYNTLRGDKTLGADYKNVSYDQFKEVISSNPDARKDVFSDLKAQNLVSRDNADDYWAAVGIGSGQPPKVSLAPPTPTNPSSQTASQIAGRPVKVEQRPTDTPYFKQWDSQAQLQQEAKSPVFRDFTLAQNVLKDREAQEARNPYGYIKELLSGKVIVFSKDGTEPEREFASMNEAQSVLAQQGLKAAPNGLIMPTKEAEEVFNQRPAEEQQQIIQGTSGAELARERAREKKSIGQVTEDLGATVWAGGKRMSKNLIAGIENTLMKVPLATGFLSSNPYAMAEQIPLAMKANKEMYRQTAEAEKEFEKVLAERGIQTSVLSAIEKGQANRIPESVLYTVGDAAMQIIPAILTYGGSAYFQTLPDAYKEGVDAIAKKTGRTAEQVIESGDDAMVVAQLSAGLQAALEKAGAGMVSNAIASKGGYAAIRDILMKKGLGKNLSRLGGAAFESVGEGTTEYAQELTGQLATDAATSKSVKEFLDKFPETFFDPEKMRQRNEAFVGGMVGGGGLIGAGKTAKAFIGTMRNPKVANTIEDVPVASQESAVVTEDGKVVYDEKNVEVTPEEFQAYQEGVIDPERQAGLADDVAKGVTPESVAESDPLYARMLAAEYAKQETPLDLDAELAALKGLQMEDEEAAPGFDEEIPEESVQLPDETGENVDVVDAGQEVDASGGEPVAAEPGGPENQGEVVSPLQQKINETESLEQQDSSEKDLAELDETSVNSIDDIKKISSKLVDFNKENGNTIVEKDGTPMVVYHNTNSNELVREGKVGDVGVFFTPKVDAYSEKGNTKYAAILNIKNPYFVSFGVHMDKKKLEQIKNAGYDAIITHEGYSFDRYETDSPEEYAANANKYNNVKGRDNRDTLDMSKAHEIIVFDKKNIKELAKIDNKTGKIQISKNQQSNETSPILSKTESQPIVKQPAVPLTTGEGGNRNAPVKGRKQVERSLQDLSEAQDPISKLKAIQTFENNVRLAPNAATEEEIALIRNEKERLAKEGYEIWDLTGRKFNQGYKVLVQESIPDENLEEGEEIITRVISPAIMKDGVMIKAAEVVVTVGTKKKQSVPLTTGEGKEGESARKSWDIPQYKSEIQRLQAEDPKANADEIKKLTKELGEKVMESLKGFEPPKKKTQTQKKQTPIEEAIFEYEEGTDTFGDLVNKIEGIAFETESKVLEDAVAAYRAAQQEDYKLSGRGDMDAAEAAFLSKIKSNPVQSPIQSFDAAQSLKGEPNKFIEKVRKGFNAITKAMGREVKMDFISNEEAERIINEPGVKRQVEAWHGSPYEFDSFDLRSIGSGEGEQAFGWGLYFTDLENIARDYAKKLSKRAVKIAGFTKEEFINRVENRLLKDAGSVNLWSGGGLYKEDFDIQVFVKGLDRIRDYIEFYEKLDQDDGLGRYSEKEYEGAKKFIENAYAKLGSPNLYKVSLHKGKTPDQYTWLEWDKPLTNKQADLIKTKLQKDKHWIVDKLSENEQGKDQRASGQRVYSDLSTLFGSDKKASLFLLESGIDGIKYPAESISRGATSDTARGFNYVVFDENAISIEEHISFMRNSQGKVLGFVQKQPDGSYKIWIDPATTDAETPIHEIAGHIFLPLIKESNPDVYAKGAELIQNSPYLKAAEALGLDGDAAIEEALAQAIGEKGRKLAESKRKGFLDWLKTMWQKVGEALKLNVPLENLTLGMFTDLIAGSVLMGESLGEKANEQQTIRDFDSAQSLKGEEGRNARKALKESMGKEQYKDLETITNKFPQIAKDLESRGVWKIDCP